MKKSILLFGLISGLNAHALSTVNLFTGSGSYGGPSLAGTLSWHVANGQAEINVSLTDPNIDIWGLSFNVNGIDSSDFAFNVTDRERWSVRGLNTVEGIGTDQFDYSLYGPTEDQGGANALRVLISGAALSQDSDLFRANTISGNVNWEDILHSSHFALLTDHGLVSDIHLEQQEVIEDGQPVLKWVPTAYVSNDASPVPDGGSTALMAGLGLIGLAFVRRCVSKTAS